MPIELISGLELDGIRTDAEQLYTGRCNIYRRDEVPPSAVDVDGSLVIPRQVLYTDIDCTLSPILSRRDRFDEFGQALIFTRQYRVRVHWSIANIRIRDLVEISFSTDPGAMTPTQSDLVGREFEVRDVVVSNHNSVRILTVQDSEE